MAKQFVLPAVFTAIDKFSSPVNKMASSAETSMARMERKFRKVGSTAFDVSKKSATLATSIIAPLGIVANEAVKFEKSMANVSTLIDTNTESIEKMGEDVLALSTKLPVPIEELTASLYDIRSAGIAAKDSMATLQESSKLSAAGLSTVEESTNILTSALNSFKSEGLNAAQTSDILFKTVKFGKTTISELTAGFGAAAPIIESAGVKLADFQAATAALTTTGTPATVAQNQLKTAIAKLKGPTKDMEKVFKALGVTTDKELIQKYGSLGASFDAVQEQIEKQGLSAKKTWGSIEALAGVTALTSTVNEQYTSTLADMTDGQNAVNGAFDKQSKTGAASMQIMKNNLQNLAITLGNAVLPLISEMVAAISPVIKSMAKWMKNNKSTVKTIVKVAAVIGGLAAAVSLVSGVVGIATKAFGIYQFALKAGATVTKAIPALQWLWNAALTANPIGAVVAAVALLAAGVYSLTQAYSSQTTAERLNSEVRKEALKNTAAQRGEVLVLFEALKKAEQGSAGYNRTLEKLNEIQPGIIDKYNLTEKSLKRISAAQKDVMANIISQAESEVRATKIKEKLMEIEEAQGKSAFALNLFTNAQKWDYIRGLREEVNLLAEKQATVDINEAEKLSQQQVDSDGSIGSVVNPTATETSTVKTNNTVETNKLEINVNAPEGTTVSGNGGTGVKLGTTRK